MDDESYLTQKLEWVKYRLGLLDRIDEKFLEIRQLAEYARDNRLAASKLC